MNLLLCYDTETQKLPLFSEPSDHPDQPHIVQLAAALVDLDTRQTVSSMDVIIKPNGWIIPDETIAIHGITNEIASEVGIAEESAVAMFLALWNCRTRCGHNEQFDARILRIAMKRFPNVFSESLGERWKAGTAICTAKLATPIVKCPPSAKMKAAGRFHHKTANLGEAYQFFTGKPLENAHSAMADVEGCMAVYFGVQDYQAKEVA